MAEAQLTVRVNVKKISPNRPQFWPGTEQPYPFFKLRGKKNMRFGSGEIDVYKYVNGLGYDGHGSRHDIDGNPYKGDDHSCPCEQCRKSKTPSDVWWVIIVRTATHVVFDAIEARQTSFRLFYDKEDSPTTILSGFKIGNANVSHDKCSLSLVTCDVIGAKLFKMVECLYAKTYRVVFQYRKRSNEKLNFIVSHPHGCSKQVSLGRWVVNEKVSSYNNRYDTTRLTYTTCTCPGSSGASVQCVGVANSHYHSGALSGGKNVSGAGFYSCQHECLVIEDTEADLHKHYVDCTKNPDHRQFISFKQFSLEHLPEGYRDDVLFDLIVVSGNLTVRVDVKMTSPHRPDVWPGTSVPYPFYDLRGKTNMRLGSGEVSVYKFIKGCGSDGYGSDLNIYGQKYSTAYQSCPCKKCQNSGNASHVWYEILVRTATHVVFDAIEASHTTCKLFYDDHDSPVVILDQFQVYNGSVENDKCDMKYVTCDNELGEQLFNLVKRLYVLKSSLYFKYRKRSDSTLCFIVSHPHGTTKQVSIGYWVDNRKVSDYNKKYNMTQLMYTTCTCPGSSGANVSCVGVANSHFHSGAHLKGLNVSCAGFCSKRDMKIPPE